MDDGHSQAIEEYHAREELRVRQRHAAAMATASRPRTPERRSTPSKSTRVLKLLHSPGDSPRRETLRKPAGTAVGVEDLAAPQPQPQPQPQQHTRASWLPVLELLVLALGAETFARWPEVERALQQQVGPVPRFDFALEARLGCDVLWHLALCALVAADFPPGWGTAVVGLALWLATLSSDWGVADLPSLAALFTATLALDKLVERRSPTALAHCLAAGLGLAAVYAGQASKLASILVLVVATRLF